MSSTESRKDPFGAFRFELRFSDKWTGGFSECSGLQIETEFHEFNEGGYNQWIRKRPTRSKQSNITLKRGVVDRRLYDWYIDFLDGTVVYKGCRIVVFDPTGKDELMAWDLKNAIPCKWVGPDLQAGQSNVAVETVELCHEGLTRSK